jgi:hypothetical protein
VTYFEPEGEKSLRDLVHEGIKALPWPLEPNTMIPYEQIGEWTGRPFPFPSYTSAGFVLPNYAPMDDVKEDLLRSEGLLLIAEPNVGYRVATAAEHVQYADSQFKKAATALSSAVLAVVAARPDRLTPADREMAKEIQTEAQMESRVLRAKRRAWITRRNRWLEESA